MRNVQFIFEEYEQCGFEFQNLIDYFLAFLLCKQFGLSENQKESQSPGGFSIELLLFL